MQVAECGNVYQRVIARRARFWLHTKKNTTTRRLMNIPLSDEIYGFLIRL